MPKVFRPKLANPGTKTTSSQDAAQPPKQDSKPKSPSPVLSPLTRKAPDPAPNVDPLPLPTISNSLKQTSVNNQSGVDIDQVVLEKRALPTPDLKVELFVTRKEKRAPSKCIRDSCPAGDQPLDRSSVSLRSLLHWTPTNKPPPSYRLERSNEPSSASSVASEKQEPSVKEPSIKPSLASPTSPTAPTQLDMLAPQLRLDANGNIVIDETSLLVSVPEATDRSNLRHVNEEGGVLNVTYNSFRRPPDRQGGRWKNREIIRFYRALSTVGPDFYLMNNLFPNRTRSELKRKFKRESRVNPYLVDQALRNRRSYDLAALVPFSDDEEDEKDVKVAVTAGPKSEETKPPRKPRRRISKSANSDTLDNIIDSVLAQYTRDKSPPSCSPTSRPSDAFSLPVADADASNMNEFAPSSDPSLRVRAPGAHTLLQQMILHKQQQSESAIQPVSNTTEAEPSDPPVSPSVPQAAVEPPRTRPFSSLSTTDRLLQLSQSILGD